MLQSLPLVFVLAGVALYTVLAGADFGAGFWQLFAGRGPQAEEVREHAHHSLAPVWEANHVWLIFVLTVFWTAYPKAFGSIASTLAVVLSGALLGIIFRGAAYALRSGAFERARVRRHRHDLLAVLDPHPVRAGGGRRRHRHQPGAGRQRLRAICSRAG